MADFEQYRPGIEELGGRIIAASCDTLEAASGTVRDLDLGFTVLYGLDPDATSRTIDCYTGVRDGKSHIQPAGFVLRPDGTIVHAIYSTGKVGRLTAADAITLLKDLRS